MRRAAVLGFVLFLLSAWLALPAAATKGTPHRVTICHATGSKTNPYVRETPDVAQILGPHGHDHHPRDIIPPFNFGPGEQYAGKNWPGGFVTWDNGCHIAEETTTTTVGSTTTTAPCDCVTSTTTPTTDPATTTTTVAASTTTTGAAATMTTAAATSSQPTTTTTSALFHAASKQLPFTGGHSELALFSSAAVAGGWVLARRYGRRGRYGRRRHSA